MFVANLGPFALGLFALGLVILGSQRTSLAQPLPPELDHLKCYQIEDPLTPAQYVADLNTRLGVEEDCRIRVPARFYCTAASKAILSTPPPPGGGPSGGQAGDFLCYSVRCRDGDTPAEVRVEDQFGARRIRLEAERLVCAPADTSICGNGQIDPGEQCDPPATLCAAPCKDDCTCDFSNCCDCPGGCTQGFFCPTECGVVVGGTCNADGRCEAPPPACPCGAGCRTDDGAFGICRPSRQSPSECSCRELPIAPSRR
jgi:hypothetical protein